MPVLISRFILFPGFQPHLSKPRRLRPREIPPPPHLWSLDPPVLLSGPQYIYLWSPTLQRQNTEISKQIFPEKEYRGLSPNFHIHGSVSDLYISAIGLPSLLEEICRPILGTIAHRHTNIQIGAEAALFPEKEYIKGIFVAV